MNQINIDVKSFDSLYIKKSIQQIEKIAFFLNSLNIKIIPFPVSRKKITVLRSPHIDKKSREQFEMKTYKFQIIVSHLSVSKLSIFLYILKNTLFPGIELKISVKYFTFL